MFPEDRVLVAVINRKRDLAIARDEHWYRIPQHRMPRGVNAEYLAFFLSGAFGGMNGAVHYFAEKRGLELARRKDLLPREDKHPRVNEVYYKVALGALVEKKPPVLNATRRPISFVYTTWDRFVHARSVSDLYSDNDYFVDRIYHALRDRGVSAERYWDAEHRDTGLPAHLRILRDERAAGKQDQLVFMDRSQGEDAILAEIYAAIAAHSGPITVRIPLEGG